MKSKQFVPSVLWRCWLGGRKGIRPVKNWVVRCWCGYLSGARCRLAYVQLMPLPLTISCSSKIQIGFTFLVPAHPGSPGQRAVKRVCVWVCEKQTVTSAKSSTLIPIHISHCLQEKQHYNVCKHYAQYIIYPLTWLLSYDQLKYFSATGLYAATVTVHDSYVTISLFAKETG